MNQNDDRSSKKRKLPSVAAHLSDEHAESDLLASLGSTLHNMDQYEQDVLKTAQLEQTPRLSGMGFPSLAKLAPSGRALSDLPHFQTILANVRQQLTQQPHNLTLLLQQQMLLNVIHTTTNDFDQCLRPQEELKQEHARRLRFQRQRQQEQQNDSTLKPAARRTKNTQEIQRKVPQKSSLKPSTITFQADEDEAMAINRLEQIKQQKKSVSFAETPRRRIGIQKRRRNSKDNADEETEEELQQRKDQLRKFRQEREERRRKRRQKWMAVAQTKSTHNNDNCDVDDEEAELEFTNDGDEVSTKPLEERKSQKKISDEQSMTLTTTTTTITTNENATNIDLETTATSTSVKTMCPLCQEEIEAPDQGRLDEELSKHMGDCQTSRRRTRGQRQSSRQAAIKVKSYAEPDDEEGEDDVPAISQTKYNTRTRARKQRRNVDNQGDEVYETTSRDDEEEELLVDTIHDTLSSDERSANRINPPESSQALDDFEEDDYEDRVDNWIVNGVAKMRDMKERDQDEQPPGEEIYDGGLLIPAWINDRLFPYQRTGLQWMWELHRQQAGGIIGGKRKGEGC